MATKKKEPKEVPKKPKAKAKADKPKGSLGNLEGKVHKLTVEDQSKGGDASVQARLRKRTLREGLMAVLSVPNKDKAMAEKLVDFGLDPDENVYLAQIIRSLLDKSSDGDVKATKLLCEILGEGAITQEVNLNVSGSGVQFYLPEKEKDEDEG